MAFSLNIVANQLFCFISVYLYQEYSQDVTEGTTNALWKIVGCLFALSVLSMISFLLLIDRNYVGTFFDTTNGKGWVSRKLFQNEESKFAIFEYHPSFYMHVSSDLMKWLNDNWSRWEEERPEWFVSTIFGYEWNILPLLNPRLLLFRLIFSNTIPPISSSFL